MTATATGVLLIPLLIGLVLLLWKLWAFGSLFPRLGLRAAEGWVPILNQARLNRRGGLPGWLSLGRLALLIALIGRVATAVADPGAALPAARLLDLVCWVLVAVVCIGRVFEIVAMHRISAEAGRGAGFTVLAALITPVWAMLLARGIGRGRALAGAEAVEPRFEAPPFSDSVAAAETHAVPTLGIAGVRRSGAVPVNPLGSTTEAEYERLAAESFLGPPAAPLGSAAVAEPFSWTAVWRPLDDERAGAESPPSVIPPVPAAPPPDLAPSPAVSKPTGITGAFPPLRPDEVRRPEPRIERDGDPDRTIIVPHPAGSGWSLRLPDGRVLPIAADDIVIGRRPEAREGAGVLAIADPTRTLSKSHVRLRLDGERATVEDLGSTNGLFLVHADGHEEPVPPGRAVPATARMVFGTLEVELLRDGEAT